MNLTAVILTKNEAHIIKECVMSLSFCDEIIIIDDHSTDKTLEVVRSLKHSNMLIKSRSLDGDFASQRNFGLDQSSGEWVLFVDADEVVPKELATEISHVVSSSPADISGYYVRRQDSMWGKRLEYGETGKIKLLRLARKNKGKWKGHVHEVWDVKGKLRDLQHPLLHFPHPTVSEFLSQVNYYSTLRAQELYDKKVRSNFFTIILYSKAKFFKNYIFNQGYKDGTHGFIHAVIMSFHSFLVRGKLYLLWKGIKNT